MKFGVRTVFFLMTGVSLFAQEAYVPGLNIAARNRMNARPRVFLQAASHGDRWAALRDQSMEMSKDFERKCPEVQVTINPQAADYTVLLNHLEVGFARDNQFQIADRNGDLLSQTREGWSIKNGVKRACDVILTNWIVR